MARLYFSAPNNCHVTPMFLYSSLMCSKPCNCATRAKSEMIMDFKFIFNCPIVFNFLCFTPALACCLLLVVRLGVRAPKVDASRPAVSSMATVVPISKSLVVSAATDHHGGFGIWS